MKNKKKVLALALAVCLIATISFGTLAWFNDADSVTNEFYVADSDGNGMPDFTIDVKEQKVDEDGNLVVDEGGNRVYDEDDNGNDYKNIIAGDELPKYVVVENTGDYDQWVRINITISDWSVWEEAIIKALKAEGTNNTGETAINNYVYNNLLDGFERSLYEGTGHRTVAKEADTATYTLYYKQIVNPGDEFQVMQNVKIPSVLEQGDMNFGTDGFTITVKAEAVQVDNLEANTASAAFEEVGWAIGAEYGANSAA